MDLTETRAMTISCEEGGLVAALAIDKKDDLHGLRPYESTANIDQIAERAFCIGRHHIEARGDFLALLGRAPHLDGSR